MADEKRRAAERAARARPGDEAADLAVLREAARAGRGRHWRKIGHWVIHETGQAHLGGILREVQELGGGDALLLFHPAFFLAGAGGLEGRPANAGPVQYDTAGGDQPVEEYAHFGVRLSLMDADLRQELERMAGTR